MIKELRPDERLHLIGLLCRLPHIEHLTERLSLLDALDREVRQNIEVCDVPPTHISNIVNSLGGETYFELSDGSYPIMIVIKTAQNKVRGTNLYNELQAFMEILKDRYGSPSTEPILTSQNSRKRVAPPSSIAFFQQELDTLIQAITVLCEQLESTIIFFSSDVLPSQCRRISSDITEACIPIYVFASLLRQSENLPLEVVAHDIWLRKELVGFDREAKALKRGIGHFEEVDAILLKQPQGKRKEIQQEIAILLRRCTLLLSTLKDLQNVLDKQGTPGSELTDISGS